MLCVLIHGTLVNDGMEKGEENTKSYTTLIKKLRVRPFLYHASGLGFFKIVLSTFLFCIDIP